MLAENNINNEHMLSQCYDWVVVIKGHKSGIHVLIQEKLNYSNILYIHCFNYQFPLVIIAVICNASEVDKFFEYCRLMHKNV